MGNKAKRTNIELMPADLAHIASIKDATGARTFVGAIRWALVFAGRDLEALAPAKVEGSGNVIFALDADTQHVGWVVANQREIIESGTYHIPRSKDYMVRIVEFWNWLEHKLKVYRPAILAYEEPHGANRNPESVRKLGMVMGCGLVGAIQYRCRFLPINPKTASATGYHKRDLFSAAALLGKGKGDIDGHEADAAGVWMAAVNVMNQEVLSE